MRADAWAATAAWVTAGIALVTVLVAGWYARKQVTELQTSRREQAQPNVVVYAEPNALIFQALEVVIKNFGSTPAKNVRITFDICPQVSPSAQEGTEVTDLWYPDLIPTLAPTQEWRALWDYAPRRFKYPGELASQHHATVSYEDSHGKRFKNEGVLEWDSLRGVNRIVVRSIHDIAKLLEKQNDTLREISRALVSITSPEKGAWVFGADASKELEARAEEYAREIREVNGALRALGFDEPSADSDTHTGEE